VRKLSIAAVIVTLCAGALAAQTGKKPAHGTIAEAQAMLKKALEHYKKVGRTQALADFTGKKAPFSDRDLYVFCIGPDRLVSAHGGDAKQLGVHIDGLKDVDGKQFAVEVWNVGQKPDGGAVEYKWQNPVTKKVEDKVSFVAKAGTDICGVGAYQ
jgi:cytochrome c